MIVRTIEHGEKVLASLSTAAWIAKDTETEPKQKWVSHPESTLIWQRHRIRIFSICHKGVSYSFPTNRINPAYPSIFRWAEMFEEFKRKHPNIVWVFHNANYDLRVLEDEKFGRYPIFWDTMISSWMSNANIDKSLKARAPLYGRYIRDTKTINFDDEKELAEYAEGDVVVTDEIYQQHLFNRVVRPITLVFQGPNGKVSEINRVAIHKLSVTGETLSPFDRLFLRSQEFPVLRATLDAEKNGVPISLPQLHEIRKKMEADEVRLRKSLFRHAGQKFNLNSGPQKTQVLLGLGCNITKKSRKTGAFSVDNESLLSLKGQHPIVDDLLEYAKVSKLKGTYIGENGMEYYVNDLTGCIHPNLNTVGAVTGRFSCVAGDTLLDTSRGTFRIDDYIPKSGDRILTHLGRWKRILRKIYKGEAEMFRVALSNGSSLVCTKEHRVFSVSGWIPVAKLTVGSKVHSYEYIEKRCNSESGVGVEDLLCGRQTDNRGNFEALSGYEAHRYGDFALKPAPSQTEGGEGVTLFTQQGRRKEPYAGQVWFPSPQLCRGSRGRSRVSDAKSRRNLSLRSSASSSDSSRDRPSSERFRDSSFGWEQEEQQIEQFGSLSRISSPRTPCEEVEVTEITYVGELGVWDIEVEGDHSYCAQGFLNHNSSSPNLQNIPARNDRYGLKKCFIAPKDELFICMDFSQIELRVMALLSGDPLMTEVLNTPDGDIHLTTSQKLKVDRDPVAKQCNFLLIFGGGAQALAQRLKLEGHVVTELACEQYIVDFDSTYSRIKAFREEAFAFHRTNGYIPLLTGRRRVIENIDSSNRYLRHKAETQLANNIVQGSAQDLTKELIVRCDFNRPNFDKLMPQRIEMNKAHRAVLAAQSLKVEKYRSMFRKSGMKWRLQVHDEVLYSAHKKDALDCAHAISDLMTFHPYFEPLWKMSVVIRGDGGVGENWSLAKKPADKSLKVASPIYSIAA